MPLRQHELDRLLALHPQAEVVNESDGTSSVLIPKVPLPDGWSQAESSVGFVVPNGYPAAQPDCFYADHALRLASGSMPMNSGFQSLRATEMLWFSWHLASWAPHRDDALSYLRFVESRFRNAK